MQETLETSEGYQIKECEWEAIKLSMDFEQEQIKYLYHQQDLLFDRLNFFLISTAFLIGAFAVIVSTNGYADAEKLAYLRYLSYAVVVSGLLLSSIYFVTNYYNSTALKAGLTPSKGNDLADLNKWTEGLFKSASLPSFSNRFFISIFAVGMNPQTYIVPLLFILFWLIALGLILIPNLPVVIPLPLFISSVVVAVFIIFLAWTWHIRQKDMPDTNAQTKQENVQR
jgi:hypothetical protein